MLKIRNRIFRRTNLARGLAIAGVIAAVGGIALAKSYDHMQGETGYQWGLRVFGHDDGGAKSASEVARDLGAAEPRSLSDQVKSAKESYDAFVREGESRRAAEAKEAAANVKAGAEARLAASERDKVKVVVDPKVDLRPLYDVTPRTHQSSAVSEVDRSERHERSRPEPSERSSTERDSFDRAGVERAREIERAERIGRTG